jgi:hypothetical protein
MACKLSQWIYSRKHRPRELHVGYRLFAFVEPVLGLLGVIDYMQQDHTKKQELGARLT